MKDAPINAITQEDWVGIRMIYLLLAYDPSAASHPEVQRAMSFYAEKTGGVHYDNFWPAVLDLLRKDNGWRNTFTETGSSLNRQLASTVTINYQTDAVWDKKI